MDDNIVKYVQEKLFMYLPINRFDEFMVPFEKTFVGLLTLNSIEAYRLDNIKVSRLFCGLLSNVIENHYWPFP